MNDFKSKLNTSMIENQFNLINDDLFQIEFNNQELSYLPINQNQTIQQSYQVNQQQQQFSTLSPLETSLISLPSTVSKLSLPQQQTNQAIVQQLTSNYLSSNNNLPQFSSNNQLFFPNKTTIFTSSISKNEPCISFNENNSNHVNFQLVQSNEPINNKEQSVSTTPIDIITQEYMKKERKKLRNRLAATKCRQKKQQKITQLEETINFLRTFVNELEKQHSKLEEKIKKLKNLLQNHIQAGCKIELNY